MKKFGLEDQKFFLFVGTIQPRKNLERLIRAFSLYCHSERSEESLTNVSHNKTDIKSEINTLRSEMNEKFSTVYTNQAKINQNVSSFGNDIINRIDRLTQRISALATSATKPAEQ